MGDFNSKFDHAALNLITDQGVEKTALWSKTDVCAEYIRANWYDHKLNVRSAYEGCFEPFTNIAVERGKVFQWLLDHIFYSKELRLCELLHNPDIYTMFETGVIPNAHFPSDHLPIAAGFYY
jgi:mRNA deadenylase 3'-5' endonuclease subunit Ccr4